MRRTPYEVNEIVVCSLSIAQLLNQTFSSLPSSTDLSESLDCTSTQPPDGNLDRKQHVKCLAGIY